ncbi:alpha/beta hydrolase [Actinomadura craniellae]|uniref:Alpha/beta hydrolase n=1 Tax=Actinomadura craniellae TaxID=2231787 RepID=A0A365HD00_9ACTN|nr:alpha/beta hydrolase [Actinomadura craniellae]RAY16892.1 alpha/beta hydrolase [Actinomadura craniellae]
MAEQIFHPQLRAARFLPRTTVGPRNLRLFRAGIRLAGLASRARAQAVQVDRDVSVQLFRPGSPRQPAPALLWIHGGGMVFGSALQDARLCRDWAERLGAVVASVEYRLAPEHPFPLPLEDCYTALRWLAARPDVDTGRIAIGGASAGGGLAAALALLARERDLISPVLQLLSYPMLDDRTAARTDADPRRLRIWNNTSNRFGWRAYLGPAAAGPVPPLAAPARHDDLSGVAPAWIGVGTRDLFHDEDVAYADRLRQAGVPCALHVVPGAYHAFDILEARAPVSREYLQAQTEALDTALNGPGPAGP